jgi:hypothetical protein
VTRLRDGPPGFGSWEGLGFFLLAAASILGLGPTQPPIQWVPEVLSPGVKRPGREADYSPPSAVEVKNQWSYTCISQICLQWRDAQLSSGRGTTLSLYVFMTWYFVKQKTQWQLYLYLYSYVFIILELSRIQEMNRHRCYSRYWIRCTLCITLLIIHVASAYGINCSVKCLDCRCSLELSFAVREGDVP